MKFLKIQLVFASCLLFISLSAQPPRGIAWSKNGNSYYTIADKGIVEITLPGRTTQTLASAAQLTPKGAKEPVTIRNFFLSDDKRKLLVYTNSKRVWRYDTRGDYWVLDLSNHTLRQLGKGLPESSLMFAKLSPDGKKAAYVSRHNIYAEDLTTHKITQLTTDGTDRIINGTFDWVYEEEFSTRDGFRWSPDSKKIAFWNIDARKIRNFLMINNTDSIYAYNVPVEYPKVGYKPSPAKIGIVDVASKNKKWMSIPGESDNNYLPRMEWADNNAIVVQQLNRKQNQSTLYTVNAANGVAKAFYKEKNNAWIDIKSRWHDSPVGWDWIENNKAFLWMTEKDGWQHLYRIDLAGNEKLITKGAYDVIDLLAVNEQEGYVYFLASPENATQQYLYRTRLDGSSAPEKLSPATEKGTHDYDLSPDGKFARHTFSNVNTYPVREWVTLPGHTTIGDKANQNALPADIPRVNMVQIKTVKGATMDASVLLPKNFDSTKKYPVLFYVYTEPGGATVKDKFGSGRPNLYNGDFSGDGYIYISVDSRGTPAPKGAAWRKSIYEKVGILNIHDQADAAREIMKWRFVDTSRIAVWGWSGGGSTTLNLLFQYPEIYKTGIAIAAVANRLTYDNIYEERYMGLPQENAAAYKQASAITHAAGLKGNLLLVHGTGDDNVHYQNAEMLINELIRHNKLFNLMVYPNRSHSISEGEGTGKHLSNLFTKFLREHCPPGAR
ncbi:S9 family peptidase [Haoranjiania flava]|uniref:S9 family peptidase n=1 Tax=Haoranjiania flava TaxID=1856322 RepID=A0AAE3LJ21_9BACT|nr:S9 family peptidase [Haoranjiania flava]MCU7693163.1 S9 family peptidase [Haoranjiania flava]